MSFSEHDLNRASAIDTDPSPEPRLITRGNNGRSTGIALEDHAERSPSTEPRRRRSPRKWLRRTGIIVVSLVLLLVVCLFCAALYLRHSMRAALPQLDGEIRVPGLSAPVTVHRNAQDVPSIEAQSLDDVLFAQGFVTASDRLWQMDVLRRHAAGELAEILGPSLVDHDRTQRYLQLAEAADRAVQALPPDELHQFEAYARGVNAYIAASQDRLPLEFHLLHYKPTAWSPRDSLLVYLVMFQDLSTGYTFKLNREVLSAHLPKELVNDLYPSGSWRDRPPTQGPPDLTSPRGEVEQIPLDPSQVSNHPLPGPFAAPEELLHVQSIVAGERCADCVSGSNNWAVAGSRSASGFPLLSNDMHLNLTAPDIWYEAGLHAPQGASPALDVTGFTLPGVPFVIVGRNAHVAWGFTSLEGDVQDVRVEHLRGVGPNTEFERSDRTWTLARHHQELIRVRGGRDVFLDVLTTTHTAGATSIESPIISPLYKSERRALSLSWTAYDPACIRSPFLGVNTADSGSALVAALANFGGPSLNLIYADDAKHIGYHAVGRIPIRGAAVKRPRALEPLVLPPPAPDSDENDEPDSEPQARLAVPSARPGAPSFVLSAYYPRRHRVARKPAPVKPQPVPTDATGPVIPANPPVLDYTIGSPLSVAPTDALEADQDWSGYIPYSDLPATADPASGVLATANSRITPDNYPYAVATNWVDAYRAERLYKLLENRSGLSPAEMLAVQNDVHSEFDLVIAQRLAYAIDHASPTALGRNARRLHQAADLLRSWKGEVSADAAAPAIVTATRDALWPLLLTAQIRAHDGGATDAHKAAALASLYWWHEQDYALEELLQHTPARWLPHGFANWNDFLAASLAKGLDTAHAPSNLADWRYGDIHHVDIAHPVLGSRSWISRLLGVSTGSGPQPSGGDASTIKAIGPHFGPSERFTADLADPAATLANITTGESGNPASPAYLDQFPSWLRGTTFRLPLHSAEATHTLTLLPG